MLAACSCSWHPTHGLAKSLGRGIGIPVLPMNLHTACGMPVWPGHQPMQALLMCQLTVGNHSHRKHPDMTRCFAASTTALHASHMRRMAWTSMACTTMKPPDSTVFNTLVEPAGSPPGPALQVNPFPSRCQLRKPSAQPIHKLICGLHNCATLWLEACGGHHTPRQPPSAQRLYQTIG